MGTDWHLVAEIGVPILTLFLGAWINRWFEERPSLVTYYGHVSAFKHTPPNGVPIDVFSHSIVLRNAGRKAATNVRVTHSTLPDFNVFPALAYSVNQLPGGGKEIVFPKMVPGEQLTVSYLYFPPLTYTGVNFGIRSDEGFAREIPVLLQRQYPKWFNYSVAICLLAGMVTIVYGLVQLLRHIF